MNIKLCSAKQFVIKRCKSNRHVLQIDVKWIPLPEILARRSLLEPSFRYLSPGMEGEKCRPLHHMGRIPFIHSNRFLTWNNFYICAIVYQLFLPCGTYKCLYVTIAHVLSQKTQLWSRVIFKVIFSPKVHAGVHWNILLAESLFVLSFKERI